MDKAAALDELLRGLRCLLVGPYIYTPISLLRIIVGAHALGLQGIKDFYFLLKAAIK